MGFLKHKWEYGIGLLYLVALCVSIASEFYWALLFPLFLTVCVLAIFRLDVLLLSLALLTPLSINLEEFGDFPVAMFLPTEPIMFGVLLLFIVRFVFMRGLTKEILLHPISIIVIWQLMWLCITAFTSSMPLVSFKFLLARMWFVVSFYFLGIYLFKNIKNAYRFIWLYILGMAIVSVYTVTTHASYGFDHVTAHWVMSPFFKDHTSYGAMLAFFFPFLIGFYFRRNQGGEQVAFLSILLLVFTVAIILSYTRAAWLSLVCCLGILALIRFRVKFKTLLIIGLGLAATLFVTGEELIRTIERNDQDAKGGLTEHVVSMANVSTDASNLERLNRWSSAWRMFKERPLFGWGPGTYQFKYAPFQHPSEKTIISTNAGDVGNAHSEYIGPLAEQGVIGMLNMFLLVGFVVYLGIMLTIRLADYEHRLLALCSVLALISYFLHGFLNNFLDTDKASVPVWGCIALLVSMDLYCKKKEPTE